MKKLLYTALALLIGLTACKQEDKIEKVDLGYLEIVEASANYDYEARTGYIIAKTSSHVSAVSKDESWCTVSTSGNEVLVFVTRNTGIDSRSTVVTVSADGRSADVGITQLGFSLQLSDTILDFPSGGDSKVVTFTAPSMINLEASSSETWASPLVDNAANTITITADPNTAAGTRTATIEISIVGGGEQVMTITVTQSSNLTADPVQLEFGYDNGSTAQTINFAFVDGSDSAVTASVEDPSGEWTSASTDVVCAVSDGDNTVSVTIGSNNEEVKDRAAVITLTDATGASVDVTVSQKGRPLLTSEVYGTYDIAAVNVSNGRPKMSGIIVKQLDGGDETDVTIVGLVAGLVNAPNVKSAAVNAKLDLTARTISIPYMFDTGLSFGGETKLSLRYLDNENTNDVVLHISEVGKIELPDAMMSNGMLSPDLMLCLWLTGDPQYPDGAFVDAFRYVRLTRTSESTGGGIGL